MNFWERLKFVLGWDSPIKLTDEEIITLRKLPRNWDCEKPFSESIAFARAVEERVLSPLVNNTSVRTPKSVTGTDSNLFIHPHSVKTVK